MNTSQTVPIYQFVFYHLPTSKSGCPFVSQYVIGVAGGETSTIEVKIFDNNLGEWSV